MKLRSSLLALVALVALTASTASAQTEGTPKPKTVKTTASMTLGTTNAGIGKVQTVTFVYNDVLYQALTAKLIQLTPSTSYTLVIDGKIAGSAVSTSQGVLVIKLLNPAPGPKAKVIPDTLLPIKDAHSAQIYATATQQLVASGAFSGRTRN